MSLVIRDLIKSFNQPGGGKLTVLDVHQFDVGAAGQAEQVCLIGESGGGKTTLLHLIAGLLVPDSGRIQVAGVELTELSEPGRDRMRAASVGYVFQTFNLLPAFTALENVRLGMTFGHGRHDAARAMHLLERVGLADRAHYKPSQLSVGQQQRVAIARALAGKPIILLADEPTANVDHNSAQSVLDLIRTSCDQEQISLLLVTHSMDIASTFDRVEELDEINRAFVKNNVVA